MSIEDDVERVRQVTEKMTGPFKLWVLFLYGDHGPDIYVCRTKEGALQVAAKDMENFVDHGVDGWKWIKELRENGHVQIDGRYNYEIREHEVGE